MSVLGCSKIQNRSTSLWVLVPDVPVPARFHWTSMIFYTMEVVRCDAYPRGRRQFRTCMLRGQRSSMICKMSTSCTTDNGDICMPRPAPYHGKPAGSILLGNTQRYAGHRQALTRRTSARSIPQLGLSFTIRSPHRQEAVSNLSVARRASRSFCR